MALSLHTSTKGRRAGVAALLAALVLPVAPAAAQPRPTQPPVARPSPAQPPPAQPPPARQQSVCGPHGDLRQALRTLADHDRITGATVLITDANTEGPCGSRAASVGTADLSTGRPMNAGDRLRAGSVTKTFTATVVLQLAAEHRLDLDAPVDRYLPGLVRHNGYDGRRITVRQLLRHTSGLPDYLDAPEWEHPERLRYRHFEPRELVNRALDLPRPSGTWYYATTNYLLAGMIIREVTGHEPEAEITRRVIRPLGLRDTYWPGDDTRLRGPHSRSYFTAEDGRLVDGTAWNTTFGGVGGALVSTPADLSRFITALLGGRLLPADQLADMRRTVAADPDRLWPGARYGLGLIASPLRCGGRWWGHAGTVPGGHRALTAVGPGGRTVSVALNQVPATLRAEQDFHDVVQTAFCEDPPSRATRPTEGEHQ